jgi:hypothetical protein
MLNNWNLKKISDSLTHKYIKTSSFFKVNYCVSMELK